MQLIELFNQDLLDYNKLIVRNYKKLDINEIDMVCLIRILETYRLNKKIKIQKFVNETGLSKKEVETSLHNLMTKKLYNINIGKDKDGKGCEQICLYNLFETLENIISYKDESENSLIDTEISKTIQLLESEMNRPLSNLEFDVISDWFKNFNVTYDYLKEIIVKYVKQGKLVLGNIEKEIIRTENKKYNTKPIIDEATAKNLEALDKLFNMKKQ
ncbi:MAG: DnaD domain protein [Anaeroplasmataceae bacterium]